LERNKDKHKVEITTKYQSEHLKSTIQALSTSHHTAIEQLASKLNHSDAKYQDISEKLLSTAKVNANLKESLHSTEAQVDRLQEELFKERKESQKQIADLQKDLILEREVRKLLYLFIHGCELKLKFTEKDKDGGSSFEILILAYIEIHRT
jgi:predicted nuclease with TOPRIM domain